MSQQELIHEVYEGLQQITYDLKELDLCVGTAFFYLRGQDYVLTRLKPGNQQVYTQISVYYFDNPKNLKEKAKKLVEDYFTLMEKPVTEKLETEIKQMNNNEDPRKIAEQLDQLSILNDLIKIQKRLLVSDLSEQSSVYVYAVGNEPPRVYDNLPAEGTAYSVRDVSTALTLTDLVNLVDFLIEEYNKQVKKRTVEFWKSKIQLEDLEV